MSDPRAGDEIRERMSTVRKRIEGEVDEVIEQAQALSDWRYYVRRYPWQCVAGAAVVGFLIVPRRAEDTVPALPPTPTASRVAGLPAQANDRPTSRFVPDALKLVLISAAKRTAVGFAGRKLGDVLSGVLAGEDSGRRKSAG